VQSSEFLPVKPNTPNEALTLSTSLRFGRALEKVLAIVEMVAAQGGPIGMVELLLLLLLQLCPTQMSSALPWQNLRVKSPPRLLL
jgi:hypothetical protein